MRQLGLVKASIAPFTKLMMLAVATTRTKKPQGQKWRITPPTCSTVESHVDNL